MRDRALFAAVVADLRAAGCVYAEEEARVLLDAATDPPALRDLVARRAGGEPLEQVVGWAEFDDLRVYVEPGVFVPRRRTGYLVDEAVRLAPSASVVVDLCCGSGAIGLALARRLGGRPATGDSGQVGGPTGDSGPIGGAGDAGVALYAADVAPAAVRCARRNLAPVGGVVFEGDLYSALPSALRGTVDLLVANVPYVPTAEVDLLPAEARLHEPRTALDGGTDGLDLLRRVADAAPGWLAPGGYLLSEVSDRQASTAAAVFTSYGLDVYVSSDEDLGATVVAGGRR